MPSRIARVGIVAKRGLKAASGHLADLGAWLLGRQTHVVHETETATLRGPGRQILTLSRDALVQDVDLIVVLGGNGTLLSMARRIAQSGRAIPILGVNFGGLGFLTETRIEELYTSLESVLDGTAAIDDRATLLAEAHRSGEPGDSRIVLNDVVFARSALSRTIDLSVFVSGELTMQLKADGLVVATATGSTAYSLSAGGPIVHPLVDALVVTPIAPHTLTNRPVVIPGTAVVEVQIGHARHQGNISVTYDGQAGHTLRTDDVVRVRLSGRRVRLVKGPGRSYFGVLREKLRWGER